MKTIIAPTATWIRSFAHRSKTKRGNPVWDTVYAGFHWLSGKVFTWPHLRSLTIRMACFYA